MTGAEEVPGLPALSLPVWSDFDGRDAAPKSNFARALGAGARFRVPGTSGVLRQGPCSRFMSVVRPP